MELAPLHAPVLVPGAVGDGVDFVHIAGLAGMLDGLLQKEVSRRTGRVFLIVADFQKKQGAFDPYGIVGCDGFAFGLKKVPLLPSGQPVPVSCGGSSRVRADNHTGSTPIPTHHFFPCKSKP